MKNILLPTDFSKDSLNAIHFAMDLLKKESCTFYVLNVQKASSFISADLMVENTAATIYRTLVVAAKKSIANIIHDIKNKFDNERHQFRAIVDYDNFIDSINQVCDKHRIDLIIMGTKGASGIEKVLFGSNTVSVLKRSPTPVLVVPKLSRFTGLDTVTLVIKKQTVFNTKVLQYVLRGDSSKLKVLNLVDGNNVPESLNEGFFNEFFPEAKHEFLSVHKSKMLKALDTYVEKNKVDLLVMLNKQHSFLEHWFTEHPAETFAFKARVPLMVIPH